MGFSTLTGEKICDEGICQSNVITVAWHPTLNQIFLGCGDNSIVALYDPATSKQGIIKCITKQERRRPVEGRALFDVS
jgi:hypothetical protein